jgi:arylamine N-acetyltransferase
VGPDGWQDAYLRRLGVAPAGPPSREGLTRLHRAHVARVPYETLDVQLGRPTSVLPTETVRRVLTGRGGYCVQLNSAFATLLRALGYDVTWHRAGVQLRADGPPADLVRAPHLTLVVRVEGSDLLVDVGLGDGLLEPLPLREGDYDQGPFGFRLAPATRPDADWRFDHAPTGSVAGMDVSLAPATVEDFSRWHEWLATSPESRLVRTLVVMRRDEAGADTLTGCMLARVDTSGRRRRELALAGEWFEALRDVFGLGAAVSSRRDREELWTRVRRAHLAWLASRATPVSGAR